MVDIFQRALPVLERAVSVLASKLRGEALLEHPTLAVLANLMNSMVVSIVYEPPKPKEKGSAVAVRSRYHVESGICERALLGYCAFHQHALEIVLANPKLRREINALVEAFIRDPLQRRKSGAFPALFPELGIHGTSVTYSP